MRILAQSQPQTAGSEAGLRDFPLAVPKKFPPISVLIVDDELLIRWSLGEVLRAEGYAVLEAGDGRTALRALADRERPVAVVILDYRLPDSNDLGLLATIRAVSPQSQVVLMTAYGTPEVARAALDLGAFSVVFKPIEMRDVPDLVTRARHARKG